MPYTRKEVRYLFSSGSPLTPAQKKLMQAELHANPKLGHKKKGSKGMKRGPKPNNNALRMRAGL